MCRKKVGPGSCSCDGSKAYWTGTTPSAKQEQVVNMLVKIKYLVNRPSANCVFALNCCNMYNTYL